MQSGTSAKKLSIGGAIVAAVAASSCCLGPLLLALLGVGGAGAFAAIAPYRPYVMAATAALLAGGFYLSYRRPKASADDCGCEKRNATTSRAGKLGLWVATALVVLLAVAPPLLARVAEASHRAVPVAPGTRVETARMHVQGIDCEACAAPMRKALAIVGGFHDLRLDIPAQEIAVTYEPADGRLDAYAKAIEEATGFEVTFPGRRSP